MNNIKGIVEKFRIGKDFSLQDVANKAGIASGTLFSIFERNDAKASHLVRIAEVLGIPVRYFFDDIENIDKPGHYHETKEEVTNYQMISLKLEVEKKEKEIQKLREDLETVKNKYIQLLEKGQLKDENDTRQTG